MGGSSHHGRCRGYPARVSDTFPRQYARTQRLTLGEPRTFTISPDGSRVVFTRSHSGSDSVNTLWVLDASTGVEREILNPQSLGTDDVALTPEEMRRRERVREGASGITSYSCNADVTTAVTIVGGQVVVVDLVSGAIHTPAIASGVFDVRLSPDGAHISYIRDSALCVSTHEGTERIVAADAASDVTWGLAEFIAAEEMGRYRGYWWSPDSRFLTACRVDNSPVATWYIADPAHPELPAVEHHYPAAGTNNAIVSLHVFDVDSLTQVDINLGADWEYINSVSWSNAGLIAQTQTRDQRTVTVHRINPADGSTQVVWSDIDDAWVELVPGVPALLPTGLVVTCADRDGSRRLIVDGSPVTPTSMQVRSVVSVDNVIVFIANELDTPWITEVWSYDANAQHLHQITEHGGSVSAVGSVDCLMTRVSTLEMDRAEFIVTSSESRHVIASHAETSLVQPNVRIVAVGASKIPVAILLPHDGSTAQLPVLFDPYGGPHAQRVVASRSAYNSAQWFADQGFVVVIADNAGTPGRGSVCERAVLNDLAAPVLDDQVEVVQALALLEPRADISRVGIRGWSFGGYLAALAVIRRGDVFHAAVAGAPVTDWRLYDTHYTERYLGNPSLDDSAYTATSLMNDVSTLNHPLLLIHGLADDNVVAAHTLQLSSALLAAGKPHEVLPLSGVTHMTPQEIVAENLLLHQLHFLQRSLG